MLLVLYRYTIQLIAVLLQIVSFYALSAILKDTILLRVKPPDNYH